MRYAAIRGMLEMLALPGVSGLVRRLSQCRGVIFTLHRVLPEDPAEFSPNSILQIKPDFLDYVITRVRALGFDIVSLDEALQRIAAPGRAKPFVVFTFDDAYRDNLRYALPILKKHNCPFTLYVPTALVDGIGEVWWQALEDIVASHAAIGVLRAGVNEVLPCGTVAEKRAAFDTLYGRMRQMPESDRVALIRTLGAQYGLDLDQHCRSLIMDWSELKAFADEPLCTLGAHTVHHYELAKLPLEQARNEIEQSASVIRAQYGIMPRHLSYPIGAPVSAGQREYALAAELGFASAVTTRPGGLYAHHKDMTTALPRVSLNGLFQKRRYVDVFATGAVFSAMGRG